MLTQTVMTIEKVFWRSTYTLTLLCFNEWIVFECIFIDWLRRLPDEGHMIVTLMIVTLPCARGWSMLQLAWWQDNKADHSQVSSAGVFTKVPYTSRVWFFSPSLFQNPLRPLGQCIYSYFVYRNAKSDYMPVDIKHGIYVCVVMFYSRFNTSSCFF